MPPTKKYVLPTHGFPYYLYDHQSNGDTVGEQTISTEEELKAVFDQIIPKALEQKRKCLINDWFGNCLFHIENGELIFPSRMMAELMAEIDLECVEL